MIYSTMDQAARYLDMLPGIGRILEEAAHYSPQDEFGKRVTLEGDDLYMNLAEYDTHEKADSFYAEDVFSRSVRRFTVCLVLLSAALCVAFPYRDPLSHLRSDPGMAVCAAFGFQRCFPPVPHVLGCSPVGFVSAL